MINYVKNNPEVLKQNIDVFREELSLLGEQPVTVVLGGATYDFLVENLGKEHKTVKVKHFSYTIGKEKYEKKCWRHCLTCGNKKQFYRGATHFGIAEISGRSSFLRSFEAKSTKIVELLWKFGGVEWENGS